MTNKKKLFLVTTVPMSFVFFKGQLLLLREHFDVTLISSPEPTLYSTAKENKVNSKGIKMAREISLFSDFISLFKLIGYFFKNRPDILHANTPKGSLLALAAGFLCRVSTRIYYVHGLRYQGATGFKKKLLMKMEKLSCVFATDIIAVSKGVCKKLYEDKITSKQITVIWNGSVNGIDLEYFNPQHTDIKDIRSFYKIDEDDYVFGFLGRLVADKGINELVNAFSKVNAQYSKTKLLLVGSYENNLSPLSPETLLKIQENPNIVETGPQSDVRSYLNAMDIMVFPSYREGFGMVLMEAAAMNVPAIASNIIGCNEIIEDGVNGFLVEPKNMDTLLDKLVFALENRGTIDTMKKNTRKIVQTKFEQNELWNKNIQHLLKITS